MNKNKILTKLNNIFDEMCVELFNNNTPLIHEDGVIGKEWEIIKINKNHYQIFCKRTNKILIDNIELYEIACNIGYFLNQGHLIDSYAIQQILNKNENFGKYYNEAIFYDQKSEIYRKKKDWFKFDLMKVKCQTALYRAIETKYDIQKVWF